MSLIFVELRGITRILALLPNEADFGALVWVVEALDTSLISSDRCFRKSNKLTKVVVAFNLEGKNQRCRKTDKGATL